MRLAGDDQRIDGAANAVARCRVRANRLPVPGNSMNCLGGTCGLLARDVCLSHLERMTGRMVIIGGPYRLMTRLLRSICPSNASGKRYSQKCIKMIHYENSSLLLL